jgi:hypothetical protein
MSKKVEATITCPHCYHQFKFSLYRSIWGEYPENRELVMSDNINVANCPSCKLDNKLVFPFIYTNANQHFAVWWEPEYDIQIDNDAVGYSKMLGQGNYLAAAPRIKNWNDFKNTILKFENGEIIGKPGEIGNEMQKQMNGFLKHLQDKNKKKNNGCFGMLIFVFSISLVYQAAKLLLV